MNKRSSTIAGITLVTLGIITSQALPSVDKPMSLKELQEVKGGLYSYKICSNSTVSGCPAVGAVPTTGCGPSTGGNTQNVCYNQFNMLCITTTGTTAGQMHALELRREQALVPATNSYASWVRQFTTGSATGRLLAAARTIPARDPCPSFLTLTTLTKMR
jgi:hypothetical protein